MMRRQRGLLATAVISQLSAVAAAQESGPPSAVRAELTVTHTATDQFRIEYELSRDTVSVMLGPPTPEYHDKGWRLPEEFHVTVDKKTRYAYLERKDGAPFRSVEIDVEAWRRMVRYAPQPFGVFSEGVAINTGPLGYAARIGPDRSMTEFAPTFTFRGLEGESVLVPGAKPGELEGVVFPSPGVFVYFGPADSVQRSESLHLLLDGDAPEVMRELVFESAGKYAELYDRELRDALAGPLVMLISWDDAPSLFLGGGAQGNQIMAKAGGPPDLGFNDAEKLKARAFLAHEMAHVWQANLGNDDARWFNEGEAELVSLRALEELGEQTSEQVAANLSHRVAEAVEGLGETALQSAHLRGRPQLNYSAGALLMAAAVAATAADDTRDDIFAIDRSLASIGDDERNGNPMKSFLAAIRSLGASEDACAAIESFVITHHEDPRAALLALFDATGLSYHLDGERVVIEP